MPALDKDHSIEDDYTPVKVYFRGENHTDAAERFMKRFQEGEFGDDLAAMLARGGHKVVKSDIDFDGRGVTIVVEPDGS